MKKREFVSERLYKARITNKGNSTGDSYAVTIPQQIIEEYKETYFKIVTSGPNIILVSGCQEISNEATKNNPVHV